MGVAVSRNIQLPDKDSLENSLENSLEEPVNEESSDEDTAGDIRDFRDFRDCVHCEDMYHAMAHCDTAELVSWFVDVHCDGAGVADLPRYGHLLLGFRAKESRDITVTIGDHVQYPLSMPAQQKIVPAMPGCGSLPMYALSRETMWLTADPYCEIQALYGFMRDGVQKREDAEPFLLRAPDGHLLLCAGGRLWRNDTITEYPGSTGSLSAAHVCVMRQAERAPLSCFRRTIHWTSGA